jgi:hypothetical protein
VAFDIGQHFADLQTTPRPANDAGRARVTHSIDCRKPPDVTQDADADENLRQHANLPSVRLWSINLGPKLRCCQAE